MLVLLACLAQLPGSDSGFLGCFFGSNKTNFAEKLSKGPKSQNQQYLSGLKRLATPAKKAYKDLVMRKRDCTDHELMKKLRVFKELAHYDKLQRGPQFNLPNPSSRDTMQPEVGVPMA